MSELKKKIKVAAVGGTRGAHVIQDWQRWGLADAVAFCDLSLSVVEREADVTQKEGFSRPKVFDDLDAMLDWGQFDCVVIATPDATHFDVARKVLSLHKSCLIEKPMVVNIEHARELIKLSCEVGVVAMVGHEFRHVPAMVEAKRRIQAGDIGTPRLAITLDYCGRMGSYWRRKAWRKSNRSPEMSLTLQKAIHQLDMQLFLMDSNPLKVYASAGEDHFGDNNPSGLRGEGPGIDEKSPYHPSKPLYMNGVPNERAKQDNLPVFSDDTDINDNQTVILEYASGARGTYVECFFTPDYRYEHTIIGDLGRMIIRATPGLPYTEIETLHLAETKTQIDKISGIGCHSGGDYELARAFLKAVQDGQIIQPTLLDGARAVAVCKAIDKSAVTGEPVDVLQLDEFE